MHALFRRWLLAASVMFVPGVVYAQASITGVVRDTSGAVLPGVTVEAASPALIEKSKTVVTDSEGAYKIVDLTIGLRVSEEEEREGLDISSHGETAYHR